jgi:hypothetical protein
MKAVVVTPIYSHPHPALQRRIVMAGLQWLPIYGHSDLPRVRSLLIEEGLMRTVEKIILLDADTVPVGDALERMAEAPVTGARAIWGLYPLREGDRWSVRPCEPLPALDAIEQGRRFQILSGGLGFTVIHRDSLERVGAQLPTITEDTGTKWRPFCVPLIDVNERNEATYYADDGSLCWRLRRTGTELWCDPTLRAAHAVETLITDLQG